MIENKNESNLPALTFNMPLTNFNQFTPDVNVKLAVNIGYTAQNTKTAYTTLNSLFIITLLKGCFSSAGSCTL